MQIKGIIFAGTATDKANDTVAFFRKAFGQEPQLRSWLCHNDPDLKALQEARAAPV